MLMDSVCKQFNACNDMEYTDLCYKTTVSCARKICIHDIVSNSEGGLSLAPGSVTDGCNIGCYCSSAEVTIPGCKSYALECQSVQLEELCQALCEDFVEPPKPPCGCGCCEDFVEPPKPPCGCGCCEDFVEPPKPPCGCGTCESDCIWTSTSKEASVSTACVGDIICYTIKFTNHSPVMLDMVCISDNVPAGVTLIQGSIHPAPKQGETLQTGICTGNLTAGQSVILTYSVTVDSDTLGYIVNCACAKYFYTDCRGCCKCGIGSCRNCAVKIIPDDIGITISKFADKDLVCNTCDEITYTIKISNHGSIALNDVAILDNIPQGLCYKKNSTVRNCGKSTDENPQCGIYIGTLNPQEVYTVTFVLLVCTELCGGNYPTEFVNTAIATGKAGKIIVSSESNPWTVRMNGKCLCRSVKKSFRICDLCSLKQYYFYHTGADYYNDNCMDMVIAGFGIELKYIDCCGKNKDAIFEGNVIFNNLPKNFDTTHFTVNFTDLVCYVDCCENIILEFNAKLYYCPAN